MRIKRVAAGVRMNRYCAGDAMQARVARFGTFGAKAMDARNRRRVAHFPHVAAGPESRDPQFTSSRLAEYHVQSELVKRVRVGASCAEGRLDHNVGLDGQR